MITVSPMLSPKHRNFKWTIVFQIVCARPRTFVHLIFSVNWFLPSIIQFSPNPFIHRNFDLIGKSFNPKTNGIQNQIKLGNYV